jgi:hypothetical protein
MTDYSILIRIFFVLTTITTLWFFYKATKSKTTLIGILAWMTVVAILGITGFYQVENAIPPRFTLLLGPGALFILIHFLSPRGRLITNDWDLKWLTLLHVIRIPVEIVLYYVFLEALIPDLMTFEGFNFDILSGISAPIIYYAVFIKKWVGKNTLLIWNFLCLGLLINILTIAVLSAQTPIQRLAFEQPNIGVTFFPFVWLPAVVVPIVLYAHLVSIRQLLQLKKQRG